MSNQKRFALIGSNIGPIDKSDALTDGDILVYNATTGKWVSQAFSGTAALTEAVQDIVGAMATDNTDINFTYDDGAGTLVATVIESGVDHDALANFVSDEHVAHTGVTITAGAGLTGGGDISASRSFAVGAGTGITVNADDVQLSASSIASLALADSAAQPGDAEAITGAWTFGTAAQIELLGGTDLWIRDAGFLRIYDSGDTDYGQLAHDGTNLILSHVNTTAFRIEDVNVVIPDGLLQVGNGAFDEFITGNRAFEIAKSGQAFLAVRNETDNLEFFMGAGTAAVFFGAASNHDLAIRTNNTSRMVLRAEGLENYADDAAAAAGGVLVSEMYRNGSVVQIRVS